MGELLYLLPQRELSCSPITALVQEPILVRVQGKEVEIEPGETVQVLLYPAWQQPGQLRHELCARASNWVRNLRRWWDEAQEGEEGPPPHLEDYPVLVRSVRHGADWFVCDAGALRLEDGAGLLDIGEAAQLWGVWTK